MIAAEKIGRPHRRNKQWTNPEDELLGGATAWRSVNGSGSRSASASENGGSIRVLKKSQDHNNLVMILDKNSKGDHDKNVYNDTRLSRAQPWRSRYPTPQDLKEQLAQRGNSSAGNGDGAQDSGTGSFSVWDVEGRW